MFKLTIYVLLSLSDIAPSGMIDQNSTMYYDTNIIHTSYQDCISDPSISEIYEELSRQGLSVTVKGECQEYSS